MIAPNTVALRLQYAAAIAALLLLPCAAFGQSAATPFGIPFAASPEARPTVGVSLEAGRIRIGNAYATPIAARFAFDYRRMSVSAEFAHLQLAQHQTGTSTGFGAALTLVRPQKEYRKPGMRLVSGVSYTRFSPDEAWTDVPIALLIGHRLPPPGVMVLPWVAPRVQLRTHNGSTIVMAGISLGLEAVFISNQKLKILTRSGFKVAADVSGTRSERADNRYSLAIVHKF